MELIDRIIEEAEYIVNTGATVRGAAKVFGVSKSTVHKDVADRLKKVDKTLYKKVKKVLNKNLSERHVRGGEATKLKYLKLTKKKTHSKE
jgi:putative DeoR family transcriptional regulator (stage III sporulation protein D)